jgi:hypothetical protein
MVIQILSGIVRRTVEGFVNSQIKKLHSFGVRKLKRHYSLATYHHIKVEDIRIFSNISGKILQAKMMPT